MRKSDTTSRPKPVSPFFIRRRSLPVWIARVVVGILIVYQFGYLFAITDAESARSFLNTNTALLATILAVTISFMVLGLQFLAESYTPRALSGYLKDKIVYGFLILYIALIALSMFSVVFPSLLSPIQFAQYAVLGTVFSLVYLSAFVYHVVRRIQPENLIRNSLKGIDDKQVLQEIINNQGTMVVLLPAFKPFIVLEQTLIKSISNDDIFTFVYGMERLHNKLRDYLNTLYDKHKSNDGSEYVRQSRDVHKFFLRSFSQLEAECLSRNREQFIINHLGWLFNLMRETHHQENIHVLEAIWSELDFIGQKIFLLEMRSAADVFLSEFRRYSRLENENAKKLRSIKNDSLHYAEIYSTTENRIMLQRFESDMLQSITQFGNISAQKGLESMVRDVILTFQFVLEDAFSIPDRPNRGALLYYLLKGIEEVNEKALKNGMLRTGQSIGDLYRIVLDADKRYKKDLMELTKSFCKMSLRNIENKDYFEIDLQRIAMLDLIDDSPELVPIILDTLKQSFTIVKNDPNLVERTKRSNEIIKAIKQIVTINDGKDRDITLKAEAILKEVTSDDW